MSRGGLSRSQQKGRAHTGEYAKNFNIHKYFFNSRRPCVIIG